MVRPHFRRNGEIDKQLEDLIKASAWKQAVALCDKRIKKGDRSDAAQVAKAHVLLACPVEVQQQQGRKELEKLITRNPPILDVDVLRSVHNFAIYRKDFRELLEPLWARAAETRPQDDNVFKAWFKSMFRLQWYKEAQAAAVKYKKQFPGSHQAHFWYLVTCHLLAESKDMDDQVRKVNKGLAFASLAKAAKAVRLAKVVPSDGLVLRSLEDLLFLLRVYRSQNRCEDALKILDDDCTGLSSPLGNKELQLVKERMNILKLSCQWQELWQFCKEILSNSDHESSDRRPLSPGALALGKVRDDWAVWENLVTATSKIRTEEAFIQVDACIGSFESVSRNARIARLMLYTSYHKTLEPRLLDACQHYFRDFSTKYACFLDLLPYLPSLEPQHRSQLCDTAALHSRSLIQGIDEPQTKIVQRVTTEVNVLKLHYNLIVSRSLENSTRSLLESFTCRCLRLYRLSLMLSTDQPNSERYAGDDAAVLATMALCHIAKLGEETALPRCQVILENLLIRSPHNYDALLILVRLCLKLGTSSLGMNHYTQLSIKNVQYATVSWLLYTHVSLIHPYPHVPNSKTQKAAVCMDLPKNLQAAMDWHVGANELNSEYMSKMLRDEQYNMLFDALALDRSLKVGFGRLLLLVEWSRIQRLTGASSEKKYTGNLDDLSGPIQENRDVKVIPNYEWDGEEKGSSVSVGWLKRQLQIVKLWGILGGSAHIDQAWISINCDIELLDETIPEPEKLTTLVLLNGVRIWCLYTSNDTPDNARSLIIQSLTTLTSIQKRAAEMLKSINELEGLCTTLRSNLTLPHEAYFKRYFGLLETGHAVKKVMEGVKAWNDNIPLLDSKSLLSTSAHIIDDNKALALRAEEQALTMQKALRRGNNIKDFTSVMSNGAEGRQDAIGIELMGIIDMPTMESIAEDMFESWIEALDGAVKAAKYLGSK